MIMRPFLLVFPKEDSSEVSVIENIKLLSFLTEQITGSVSTLVFVLLKSIYIDVRIVNVTLLVQFTNDRRFRRTLPFK